MVDHYVRPDGSDSNAGTGPGAGDAWLTIGKAIGATGIASGDTVYVAPGVYREVLTIGVTPAAETVVIGDTGATQFADLTAGEVMLTAYLTDDTTAPSTSVLINPNGKNLLTWEGFAFVAGANSVLLLGTASGWTLRDCTLYGRLAGASHTVTHTTTAGAASNLLFERCIFVNWGTGSNAYNQTSTLHSADYDTNIVFRRCRFFVANGTVLVQAVPTGSGAGKAGGWEIVSCDFIGGAVAVDCRNAAASATIPATVRYCLIACGGALGLNADAAGIVVEDWNRFIGTTPRAGSISAGANSLASNAHAFLPQVGQEVQWGGRARFFLTPRAGSPLLGFVDAGEAVPTTDLTGRIAPAGGESLDFAVGSTERHDTAEDGSADGYGYAIVGPGDQDITILVDATEHTIAIDAEYDSDHGATTKPQAILLGNPDLGVSGETLTMTAAVDTPETLIFAAFTPTGPGRVIVRLVSRAAAGTGKALFGPVTVT